MTWGFNTVANDDRTSAISLDAMRGQTLQRLSGVQQRLGMKGVGAAFVQATKADAIGDMGFLSSLILDMVVLGPFSAFIGAHVLGHHHGAAEAFNTAASSAGLESVALLSDQEAHGYRSRRGGDYPEGRKRCALEAAKQNRKKFNLVSGGQTGAFSFDTRAEMSCLYEILDLLDKLEDEGVKMIRLDHKQSAYDALKQVSKKLFTKSAVRSYAQPVLKAV